MVEGKGGVLYLVDRDHMGHWQPANDSHAVQTMPLPGGVFGAMTYWNHYLYVLSDSDALREFEVKDGKLSLKAKSANTFPGVSATPIVSANGAKDGVVWLLQLQGVELTRQVCGSVCLRRERCLSRTLQQQSKCRP